jgi:DNA-binding PadR family transcriptional regulator
MALSCLLDAPLSGLHGYDISKRTGIKPGTLYPMLIRLAEQHYLDAVWQTEPAHGRPPRHIYQLTDEGRAFALQLRAQSATDAPTSQRRGIA